MLFSKIAIACVVFLASAQENFTYTIPPGVGGTAVQLPNGITYVFFQAADGSIWEISTGATSTPLNASNGIKEPTTTPTNGSSNANITGGGQILPPGQAKPNTPLAAVLYGPLSNRIYSVGPGVSWQEGPLGSSNYSAEYGSSLLYAVSDSGMFANATNGTSGTGVTDVANETISVRVGFACGGDGGLCEAYFQSGWHYRQYA